MIETLRSDSKPREERTSSITYNEDSKYQIHYNDDKNDHDIRQETVENKLYRLNLLKRHIMHPILHKSCETVCK